MSIGAVLDLLRPDFPDVTISKIRFLESEGLVTPQRSPSGYRRFTAYDCSRLRFILTAQRDQYLPLKVIKAQLDALPDGELPQGPSYPPPRLVPVGGESRHVGVSNTATHPSARLTREALLERVWGHDYFGDGRLVDVHIRRLRTKVEADPASPRYVVTVRGLGYKLQP